MSKSTKPYRVLLLLLLLLSAPLSSVRAAQVNRIPPTTSYSRGLLTNETALASRVYLQISDGLVYNFDPNSFYLVNGTNVFLVPGGALTNAVLVGNTLNPQLDVGARFGAFDVDAALSTEFSMRLEGDATLTFTNWNDWHPISVTVTNTGSFALTYGNTMFWVPNQNATQVTNDWGIGAINVFHFYKDTGGNIIASDPERRAGGLTINPTDGQVPYRTGPNTFSDSIIQQIAASNLLIDHSVGGAGSFLLKFSADGNANLSVTGDHLQYNNASAVTVFNVDTNGVARIGSTRPATSSARSRRVACTV